MQPTTRLWLADPTETQLSPVFDWQAVKVGRERFGAQTCEITVRRDHDLVNGALLAPGGLFYGYGLWVFHDRWPIFQGPTLRATLKGGTDTHQAYVTIGLEGHLNHALRRRLNFSVNLTDVGMNLRANQIAINLIDAAMGGIAGPAYPTGYPGGGAGPLRTDFRTYTYRAGVPVGAPPIVWFNEQSGNNLQDVIEELCLRHDMCPVINRMSAATWSIDVQYPYRAADKTATIVLTRLRGTATGVETTVPYTLVTVARSAGAGSGSTQTQVWQTNNTALYGVYEDQLTTPNGPATACNVDVSAMIRASNPFIAYRVDARGTGQASFPRDYGWRDAVLVYDPDYGQTVSQTIIGFDYEATNGGRQWRVALQLNEGPTPTLRMMADKTGLPFGRSAGGRYRDNRG